jgi:hypothetical protein
MLPVCGSVSKVEIATLGTGLTGLDVIVTFTCGGELDGASATVSRAMLLVPSVTTVLLPDCWVTTSVPAGSRFCCACHALYQSELALSSKVSETPVVPGMLAAGKTLIPMSRLALYAP